MCMFSSSYLQLTLVDGILGHCCNGHSYHRIVIHVSSSDISHTSANAQLSNKWFTSAKCSHKLSPWTRRTCLSCQIIRGLVFPLYSAIITNHLTVASIMSSSTAYPMPSIPSSDFNSILDAALNEYQKKTSRGLLEHPLAEQVKRCDSIGAISAILQSQAREFQQFRDGDQRLMKWINPMVEVLSTFSATLGGVASIVRP
jgi:hypothetical protein